MWPELGKDQAAPDAAFWAAHMAPNAMFVETDAGDVIAYALCFADGASGDVRQIVVDPAFRGRGHGRDVMRAVRDRLRGAGCTHWHLEVRTTNAPAVALYRASGMQIARDLHIVRIDRAPLEAFAGTPDTVRRVEPADD